jgi:hypothetical protein
MFPINGRSGLDVDPLEGFTATCSVKIMSRRYNFREF